MTRTFKCGDRVVVREWDDMVSEFGINSYGSIKCRRSFVDGMRKFCGQTAVIRGMGEKLTIGERVTYIVVLEFLNLDNGRIPSWTFTTDMIEPICSYCQQTDLIDEFINSYDLLIS